MPFAIICWV